MRKSQIPLAALIGIVLFIVVAWAAISFGAGIFRLSQQANSDFNELDSVIKDIAASEVNSLENVPLRMDDKTALVFFNKDAEILEIQGVRSDAGYKAGYSISIPRPSLCIGGCLCLCKKVNKVGASAEFECSKNICSSDHDFELELYSSLLSCKDKNDNCLQGTNGGYILERNAIFTKNQPRAMSIYIQKTDKNKVVICDVLNEQGNCILPQNI